MKILTRKSILSPNSRDNGSVQKITSISTSEKTEPTSVYSNGL